MKSSMFLLAALGVVNSLVALSFTSAAHAEPGPRSPFDQEFVTTESRQVRCIVEPDDVLCSGIFANAPCPSGLSDCESDHRDQAVIAKAEGDGRLHWSPFNMQHTGYAAPGDDLVLTYGQSFHLLGWSVEPNAEGTRFTNDGTGRGMFVSRQSVVPLMTRADPDGSKVCASATEEALMAAVKSSPDISSRLAPLVGFSSIECATPFAIGMTANPSTAVQPAGILFRRDGSRWTALDIGTAMQCAQFGMTAANALEGCSV